MAKDIKKNCVFCKVANGGAITPIRFEDKDIIAVDNTNPEAPVHVVVMTKKHISSLAEAKDKNKELLGKVLLVCRDVAKKMNIDEMGYRVVTNIGKWGGQSIPHLHFHVLGGVPLSEKVGLSIEEEIPEPRTKIAKK
ncbi:MAG: HIT domain-containing protein [Patescibacteria group bacterium]|nr:HIT domain-containing protein [Patescibacteria group bacterium]